GDHPQPDPLTPGQGAQLAILLVEILPASLDLTDVGAKQDAGYQEPGDREEDERERPAHREPVDEAHLLAEGLPDIGYGVPVGRRADDGGDPPDRRRVRDAEQEAGGEVALGHAILRYPAGFLQAGAGTRAQHQVDDA